MVAGGFEPPKHNASDLKSLPFDLTREYYLRYPTLDTLFKNKNEWNQIYDYYMICMINKLFFLWKKYSMNKKTVPKMKDKKNCS